MTIKADGIASEYKVPGQYVQIKVGADGKPGFFAISNAPNDVDENGTLEFLVKAVEATEPLVNAKAGAAVEMSQVMGKGDDEFAFVYTVVVRTTKCSVPYGNRRVKCYRNDARQ